MIAAMEREFRPETLEYMAGVDAGYRKSLGQYFTPQSVRQRLLARLPRRENLKILDPGCGTGEFLLSARAHFKNPELRGWDIDERLAGIARRLVPGARIEVTDALRSSDYGAYDLVIGNPPYYEFRPDAEMRRGFGDVIRGRVNIYGLFVCQGIKLLKPGGYLAYVVSPSMNNGAYFAGLRRFIVAQCNIESLEVLDSPGLFPGAAQPVMLLVLKKGSNTGGYVFRKNGVLIFSERVAYLREAFRDKTTLGEQGYTVRTGRLVWNRNRHLLTGEAGGNIPLIWSSNITPAGLMLGNHDRLQYVKMERGYDVGPALVVNRVVGRPGAAAVRAALVPAGMRFIAENHVNVVFPPHPAKLRLAEILRQLNSPEKAGVLRAITGNTQLSRTELERLFPLDIA